MPITIYNFLKTKYIPNNILQYTFILIIIWLKIVENYKVEQYIEYLKTHQDTNMKLKILKIMFYKILTVIGILHNNIRGIYDNIIINYG